MQRRSLAAAVCVLTAAVPLLGGCSPQGPASSAAREGRTSVTFTPSGKVSDERLRQTAERLARRAHGLGVKGARASVGNGTVTVTAPGDQRGRITTLGDVGALSFRPVLHSAVVAPGSSQPPVTGSGPVPGVSADVVRAFGELECSAPASPGPALAPPPTVPSSEPTVMCDDANKTKYLVGPAELTERDVRGAVSEVNKDTLDWQVQIVLTKEGGNAFADLSGKLSAQPPPRNQIAMALDDSVLSAPAVASRIPGGKVQISGGFTRADSERLATMIESGSLPVALRSTKATYRKD